MKIVYENEEIVSVKVTSNTTDVRDTVRVRARATPRGGAVGTDA